MKSYGDHGGCYPPRPTASTASSSISIVLHKILSPIHYLLNIHGTLTRRSGGTQRPNVSKYVTGHPMDLFVKISALQTNLCWLGDLEKNNMSLKGKCCWEIDNSGCLRQLDLTMMRGFGVQNSCYLLFVRSPFPLPPSPSLQLAHSLLLYRLYNPVVIRPCNPHCQYLFNIGLLFMDKQVGNHSPSVIL